MLSAKEMRNSLIQAISKRSQTKFAKLFYEFDADPTKKSSSIVLLLAELNEQKDFYVDFNIHLKYFLDLYEELAVSNKSFLFNEAGLLVHNATKIYERRLDCVLQRIEDQLASLSNVQESQQKNTPEEPKKDVVEKPPRKRRRLVESTQDPFEFQWTRRKFKKLPEDKRFGLGTQIDRSKLMAKKLHVENFLHPALWKYSEIVDLENEDEVDSKRNYRLFTSYVEHRYNTLVPDINFRLYYKMKDYLDSDERDDENFNKSWPPLSQAFVKQYLKMEDRALEYVQDSAKRRCTASINAESIEQDNTTFNRSSVEENIQASETISNDNISKNDATINESNTELLTESGLGESIEDSVALSGTLDGTVGEIASSTVINSTQIEDTDVNKDTTTLTSSVNSQNENAENPAEIDSNNHHTSSILTTGTTETNVTENSDLQIDGTNKETIVTETSSENVENQADLLREDGDLFNKQIPITNTEESGLKSDAAKNETVKLTVHIETDVSNDSIDYLAQPSPQNDEGVCFSDLDDAPMTPITIQVEKSSLCDPEKTTERVEVDLNNLEEFQLPSHQTSVEFWPIKLNILEFPREILKKLRRPKLFTDLGEDMELFLKARCYKRTRAANESKAVRKIQLLDRSASCASFVYITPPPSPCDSVLLGFGDEGKPFLRPRCSDECLRRLSLDSGVENDLLTATPEKNSMFFPPISEHEQEIEEAEKQNSSTGPLNKDNVAKNLFGVEIVENILLQAANSETNSPNNMLAANTETEKNPEILPDTVEANENEKLAEIVATSSDKLAKDNALNIEIEPSIGCDDADNFMDVANLNHSELLEDADSLENDGKHLELCDDTVAKIQTWHRNLQPILAQSRERHHFDVFQIGTNIISEFKTKPDNILTFQHVMNGQDPSYVSRYFLSSLLLANQGNLALKVNNKCDDQPTDWCDVHFTLLSTTRHVVAVEDNIGMLPTKKSKTLPLTPILTPPKTLTPHKKAMSPKLLPPPTPTATNSRKRKLSIVAAAATATANYNVNLNCIQTIKPIGKTPRLSVSNDSGIASLESDSFDLSS